jgi:hypothetical protein
MSQPVLLIGLEEPFVPVLNIESSKPMKIGSLVGVGEDVYEVINVDPVDDPNRVQNVYVQKREEKK